MADVDDDRPRPGEPSAEPPESTGGLRRFPPRRRPEDDAWLEDDEGGTDEVRRPPSGGGREAPPPDDLGFDEPEEPPARPRSSSSSRRRASGGRGSGRGGSRRGGSRGGGAAVLQQPRARLLLGVVFAAILILVIVLVVRDCQRDKLEDSYKTYLNDVASITSQSADQGKQLRQILNNPRGQNPPQLSQSIRQLAGDASALVTQAEDLDPPGELATPNRALIRSLEYRVNGMTSLSQNLSTLLQAKDDETKAAGIAEVMKRFLTSDVIYSDEFVGPAKEALEKDDITGVEVPTGQPFLPNPGLVDTDAAKSLLPALQRRGSAGGGGDDNSGNLRGTSIVSTEALPSETRLTPGTPQAVQASDQLKWRVTIENGGDFTESGIVVTASFFYPSDPKAVDEKQAELDEIAPTQTTTVEIPGPTTPVFGEQGTLRIEVSAVSGETNTDNNAAEYPVKITI